PAGVVEDERLGGPDLEGEVAVAAEEPEARGPSLDVEVALGGEVLVVQDPAARVVVVDRHPVAVLAVAGGAARAVVPLDLHALDREGRAAADVLRDVQGELVVPVV